MKRKSAMLLISVLFISLLLVGCNNENWHVNLKSYETTNWIESNVEGSGYSTDEGYEWLLINLEMTNLETEYQYISQSSDSFNLITENGNVYDLRLEYKNTPVYIDTGRYNSLQTKEDSMVFEVPTGTDISNYKFLWKPAGGNVTTFQLKNLPEKY